MANTDTTTVDHDVTAEVRDEPVDVTVEVIVPDEQAATEPEAPTVRVLRDLLDRQLDVTHDLGSELIEVATTVSVAVAQTPALVIGEIRDGATLPNAVTESGIALREVVGGAGSNLRTAVGGYVGHQATLPNAVVVGASGVAESFLRAQGRVAAATINATFTVAAALAHGSQVREKVSHERRAVGATTDVAREAVGESWDRALGEIRGAVQGFDHAIAH